MDPERKEILIEALDIWLKTMMDCLNDHDLDEDGVMKLNVGKWWYKEVTGKEWLNA